MRSISYSNFLFLFLFLFLFQACSPKLAPPKPVDPVGTLAEHYRVENKIPGLSLAVLQGGDLVYAKGFGYADVAKKSWPMKILFI